MAQETQRTFTQAQAREMYWTLREMLFAWKTVEASNRTENAVLLATDTEAGLRAAMDAIQDGFGIMHVDSLFDGAKQVIAKIDSTDTPPPDNAAAVQAEGGKQGSGARRWRVGMHIVPTVKLPLSITALSLISALTVHSLLICLP